VDAQQPTAPTVVVTGASKGIGAAVARRLAADGYRVVAGVRRAGDAEALRAELGERVVPALLDVTDPEAVAATAALVGREVGEHGLAGLVNNAGIAVAAPLEFLPPEELRRQLEVNVVGPHAVTKALLPLLRRGRGRIVNVGSVGDRIASPLTGAYAASKFALRALTDALRLELSRWGIAVVLVEPGSTATPIWETSLAAAERLRRTLPPAAARATPDTAPRSCRDGPARGVRAPSPARPPQALQPVRAAAALSGMRRVRMRNLPPREATRTPARERSDPGRRTPGLPRGGTRRSRPSRRLGPARPHGSTPPPGGGAAVARDAGATDTRHRA
jgi:NAD(P)-dependent dehydrogenase (short-subunit alcohol dehydrogenase family)